MKLIRKSRDYDDDQYTVSVGSNWRILQCCGCQEVSMSRTDWCSEDDPHDPTDPTYFPPRVSRRKPDWLVRGDAPSYQGLLDEVYTALHADSRRLAMMKVKTAWGELAWQLGGEEAFAKIKEADADGTAPGKSVLAPVLR